MNEKNNENRNGRKILPFPWEYGQEEITLKVSSLCLWKRACDFDVPPGRRGVGIV